jgi:hypothetical protein
MWEFKALGTFAGKSQERNITMNVWRRTFYDRSVVMSCIRRWEKAAIYGDLE